MIPAKIYNTPYKIGDSLLTLYIIYWTEAGRFQPVTVFEVKPNA